MPSFCIIVRDPLGGEDAHQVVFQRQVEAARARIALAPGATAQLVVDAPGLVPLGADDVQAAGLDDARMALLPIGLDALPLGLVGGVLEFGIQVAAEHDVGTAAGHVGGDGHGAGLAGAGDDAGLALVLLGVQHLVRDLLAVEQLRHQLRGLDGGGAHQRRLAALRRSP
jgi:hypothetical protein